MRDDIPAALPLIAFAAALAVAPLIVNPVSVLIGLGAIALLAFVAEIRVARKALSVLCISAVLPAVAGIAIGLQHHERQIAERHAVDALGSERFVDVVTPIDGDWSHRPHVHVLPSDLADPDAPRRRASLRPEHYP